MVKTFVIANQKGGVGKTTTSVNLAAALARHGQRTLLVDLDPQGNATMGSGIDKRDLERSVYHVLIGLAEVKDAARPAAGDAGFDVLPANRELAGAELELVDMDRREARLSEALAAVEDDYDFVLVDCPPSLSLLTLNGFCAAHGVVIPMQCEYYALEGLSDLVSTIRTIHANFNPELRITGLLRVMFDPRMTLSQQVSSQLEQHFGDKVFKTIIPRNIRLAEAPSYGVPGVVFDPHSKGAKAYLQFAAELIAKAVPGAVKPSGKGSGKGAGKGAAKATTGAKGVAGAKGVSSSAAPRAAAGPATGPASSATPRAAPRAGKARPAVAGEAASPVAPVTPVPDYQ